MSNACFLFYLPGFFGHIAGGAFIIMVCMYFFPTIIAIIRKKPNVGAILAMNFLLGWTFIGWIVSLIWALSSDIRPQQVIINNHIPMVESGSSVRPGESGDRRATSVKIRPNTPSASSQQTPSVANRGFSGRETIQQLVLLKQLLDTGVLTQEEFNEQKRKILAS